MWNNTNKKDVNRRHILTLTVDPRTERIKKYPMAVDTYHRNSIEAEIKKIFGSPT